MKASDRVRLFIGTAEDVKVTTEDVNGHDFSSLFQTPLPFRCLCPPVAAISSPAGRDGLLRRVQLGIGFSGRRGADGKCVLRKKERKKDRSTHFLFTVFFCSWSHDAFQQTKLVPCPCPPRFYLRALPPHSRSNVAMNSFHELGCAVFWTTDSRDVES